ncbi:MAG: magnesium/cobalt transporter CorA [Planctomycetota bacterium]
MEQRRLFRRSYTKQGAAPGTLAVTDAGHPVSIGMIRFDAEGLEELELDPDAELGDLLQPGKVTWLDVRALGDGAFIERLGERFGLHPLAVADALNVGQRPKIEAYEDFYYIVVRMLELAEDERLRVEQVSLFLGPGWVISVQERPGDCLDGLRARLRKGRKQLRSSNADYLAVQIIDAIVDGYFPVLESYGEWLEEIETRILEQPDQAVLSEVYDVKRDLMTLRRAAWPMRDMLSSFLQEESELLNDASQPYLRDTADHVIQIVDVTETYRELAGSFIDIYLSSISQRTNEVMRVLTVSATIFIPLTFLAGVYGMNFDTSKPGNMPELGWSYAYPVFLGVCVLTAGGLLFLFRRLGWLGGSTKR